MGSDFQITNITHIQKGTDVIHLPTQCSCPSYTHPPQKRKSNLHQIYFWCDLQKIKINKHVKQHHEAIKEAKSNCGKLYRKNCPVSSTNKLKEKKRDGEKRHRLKRLDIFIIQL